MIVKRTGDSKPEQRVVRPTAPEVRKFGTGTGTSNGKVKWEDASKVKRRGVVFMQIYGETGTGRTSLALTAPGPIALIHTAEKLDGLVQTRAEETRVQLYNFGANLKGDPKQISAMANEHIKEFKAALADAMTWARTVIVDTHTELWELLRLARFGTLTPKGIVAHLYGPVNAEWRAIWKLFKDQERTHIIAIGQSGEEYRNDKPTGRMVQAGQNKFSYMADVVVETTKSKKVLTAEIKKGWYNLPSEGTEFDTEEETFTFHDIMELVTGQRKGEWRK